MITFSFESSKDSFLCEILFFFILFSFANIKGCSNISLIFNLVSGFTSNNLLIKSMHSLDIFLSLSKTKSCFFIFIITFLSFFDFDLKGEWPIINSYNNIPKLQISTLKSYISLPTISGAIYSIVPQNVALLFTFNSLAQPKSHNFKTSFSPIKIFSGLISLCIILF